VRHDVDHLLGRAAHLLLQVLRERGSIQHQVKRCRWRDPEVDAARLRQPSPSFLLARTSLASNDKSPQWPEIRCVLTWLPFRTGAMLPAEPARADEASRAAGSVGRDSWA
jgi:hypothetical protein